MRRLTDAASQAPLSANPRQEDVFEPAENAFLAKPRLQEQIDSILKDCGAQVTRIAGTGNCFWWALERALCSNPELGVNSGKDVRYGSYAEEELPDNQVSKWKHMIKTYYQKFRQDIPAGVRDSLSRNEAWMNNPGNIDDDNYCITEWAWCVAELVGQPVWVVVVNESENAFLQVFSAQTEYAIDFDDDAIDDFLQEKREVAGNKYYGSTEPIVLTFFNKHFDLVTGYDNPEPDFESVLDNLNLFEFDGITMYTPSLV